MRILKQVSLSLKRLLVNYKNKEKIQVLFKNKATFKPNVNLSG